MANSNYTDFDSGIQTTWQPGQGSPMSGGGGGFNWSNIGKWLGGPGKGLMDLSSLAMGAYGLNKSLGIAQDQLGLQKQQEERAKLAQNMQTDNQLSLALQLSTPGTEEHERIKKAIEEGQYSAGSTQTSALT